MQTRITTNLIAACVAGLVLLTSSVESAAQSTADESSGLSAYPGARLASSVVDQEVTHYDFVLGAVERTGGAMRAKRSVRLAGHVDRLTFEIPDGISTDEVAEHYRVQLAEQNYRVLFECRARECGKSTVWANSVFGLAMLYGPDRFQRYLAARRQIDADHERLVAIYVTQRGNRKVYAHVETVLPNAPSGLEAPSGSSGTSDIVTVLERDGFVVLNGVRPDAKGQFGVGARQALLEIGEQLAALPRSEPYVVVCHLSGSSGSGDLESIRARSERCAERARSTLDPDGTLQLKIFGAGAYAPRSAPSSGQGSAQENARVELVAP
jgi:hypothetical protein